MDSGQERVSSAKSARSWLRVTTALLFSAALSGICALLALEAAVRLFWPQKPYEDWVAPDARYGHLYKPDGHFKYPFPNSSYVMDLRTNSLGFRDDEPVPAKAGERTVLFLGDSYTMGFALDVESRFDRQFARLCRDNGIPVRCVNIGVDGWGAVQATRYAEDHLDQLRPDVAVWTFCENDPYDDTSFLADPGPTPVETRPLRLFLQRHMHLYRLYCNLRWMRQHGDEVRNLGRDRAADPNIDPAAAIAIPESLWRQTLERVRNFHAALLRQNPRAVLLVQASSPTSADVRSHLSALDNGGNLLYVDLSGPAKTLSVPQRRLPHDPHWSARMHELSAHALLDRLKDVAPQEFPAPSPG